MNKKILSNGILIITTIVVAGVALLSLLLWLRSFQTINYRNLPEITLKGDGTYTMKNGDAVMLNNGISISLENIGTLERRATLYGSPIGVYKYPAAEYAYSGGSEAGVMLVVNESRFMFLSPANSGQQIIERGEINDFVHPGAVIKLISLNNDKKEATISFQSIAGNINLNNSLVVIPLAIIVQAIFVFIAEFIIKRRSTNILYRYTFYKSIMYTLPVLFLASLLDPEWGILIAILIFPIFMAESALVSLLAYKVVIDKRRSS